GPGTVPAPAPAPRPAPAGSREGLPPGGEGQQGGHGVPEPRVGGPMSEVLDEGLDLDTGDQVVEAGAGVGEQAVEVGGGARGGGLPLPVAPREPGRPHRAPRPPQRPAGQPPGALVADLEEVRLPGLPLDSGGGG